MTRLSSLEDQAIFFILLLTTDIELTHLVFFLPPHQQLVAYYPKHILSLLVNSNQYLRVSSQNRLRLQVILSFGIAFAFTFKFLCFAFD